MLVIMSNETDATEETAKAAQEVAKAASNAVDAGREMGGFVSRFISGSLEQAVGIVEDRLRYVRWENQHKLIMRAEAYMSEHGLSAPNKAIPLKNIVPLLEYATLEENDTLQDMWARLLVNGTNESTGVNIERSFIEILAQLSPLEAQILQVVYSLPFSSTQHIGIITENLPYSAKITEENPDEEYGEPSKPVKLALANLVRIGCLKFPMSWGGGEVFTQINPTLIGKEFVDACSVRENIAPS